MQRTATYYDLIRAVNLNPDEDTPRLALADYIDEIAEGEPDKARARLIRVQCALAHTPAVEVKTVGRVFGADSDKRWMFGGLCTQCTKEEFCSYHALRDRERDAIGCYEVVWRSPPCPKCKGPGGRRSKQGKGPTWFPCRHCKGKGSVGALAERVIRVEEIGEKTKGTPGYKYPLEWVRGFPVVSVPFSEMGQTYGADNVWEFWEKFMMWAIRCVRDEGASFICRDWNTAGGIPAIILEQVRRVSVKWPLVNYYDYNTALTSLIVEAAYPQVEA